MAKPLSVEVKREKIFIPAGMALKEVRQNYGLNHDASYAAKKKVSS